jgi:hypothetical protein
MKKVHFIPQVTKKPNELKHIATKCGHCDANLQNIGGKTPKKVYTIKSKA